LYINTISIWSLQSSEKHLCRFKGCVAKSVGGVSIFCLMHHLLQENALTEVYLPFLPHTPTTHTK